MQAALSPPPVGSSVYQPVQYRAIGKCFLRRSPATDSEVIKQLKEGEKFWVSEVMKVCGDTRMCVGGLDGGHLGWGSLTKTDGTELMCPDPQVQPFPVAAQQISQPPYVMHCGWVEKQGHFFKNWKRRFFVLAPATLTPAYARRHLYYYEDENSPQPKDIVPIEMCEIQRQTQEQAGKPFAFEMRIRLHNKDNYIVACESENDLTEWHQVLSSSALGVPYYQEPEPESEPEPEPEETETPRMVLVPTDCIVNPHLNNKMSAAVAASLAAADGRPAADGPPIPAPAPPFSYDFELERTVLEQHRQQQEEAQAREREQLEREAAQEAARLAEEAAENVRMAEEAEQSAAAAAEAERRAQEEQEQRAEQLREAAAQAEAQAEAEAEAAAAAAAAQAAAAAAVATVVPAPAPAVADFNVPLADGEDVSFVAAPTVAATIGGALTSAMAAAQQAAQQAHQAVAVAVASPAPASPPAYDPPPLPAPVVPGHDVTTHAAGRIGGGGGAPPPYDGPPPYVAPPAPEPAPYVVAPPPTYAESGISKVAQRVQTQGRAIGCEWSTNGCERAAQAVGLTVDSPDLSAAINWCFEHATDLNFDTPLLPDPQAASVRPPDGLAGGAVAVGGAAAFQHISPQGQATPYAAADNAAIEQARRSGQRSVRISDVTAPTGVTMRFEVRFGSQGPGSMQQINLDTGNRRIVTEVGAPSSSSSSSSPPAYPAAVAVASPAPTPPPQPQLDHRAIADCKAKLQRRRADLESVQTFLATLSESERQGQGIESVVAEVEELERQLARLERGER